ncbi:MAG: SpoIIE family protein phosphatase [Spirulina sp. SIO3F2]|nr:SpoIIE family protein phosphatase [Spirulina sp. SIO3F2]
MNDLNAFDDLEKTNYAAFGRPCFGEHVSGDTAIIEVRENHLFLAIVDVLGHGPAAHDLSLKIEEFLKENWTIDVQETLLNLHKNCQGTLGAAVGLGVLEMRTGLLSYCGVGNTVIRVLGSRSRRLYSTNGIIGSRMHTPVEQQLQLIPSDILLLYTDGIKDRFELRDYRQILYERCFTIVRRIVRDFSKPYDDATCIALKYKKNISAI